MKVYFIRHSIPSYLKLENDDNYDEASTCGLNVEGMEKCVELGNKLKELIPNLDEAFVISSPFERARQTALYSLPLGFDFKIEKDIHEWLPSKAHSILVKDFKKRNIEYIRGNYGDDIETPNEMKLRMEKVLNKYKDLGVETLIMFSHSRFISNYLNCKGLDYCEVKFLEL